MRFALVYVFVILSPQVQAFEGRCGTFELSGVLKHESGASKLFLNHGSSSELTVTFEENQLLPSSVSGVPLQLNFEIVKRCRFHCEARLKKVVSALSPFEPIPDAPLGHIIPVRSKKCL